MNLLQVEEELKKRWLPKYKWGIKHVDIWDTQTSFVFNCRDFAEVKSEITSRFSSHSKFEDIRDYALSRWYIFVANQAIISIFISHPLVRKLKDDNDFFIDGLPFELQVFSFPMNYGVKFEDAKNDKKAFLEWWYENTNAEINGNTFCLVLHSLTNESWKLRAELDWLSQNIYQYLDTFSRQNLTNLKHQGRLIHTEVLFCEK